MAASPPSLPVTAARSLTGRLINGRWKVDSLWLHPPGASGGANSVCYHVTDTKSGKKAFLKAIDYAAAFQIAAKKKTMVAAEISSLTGMFTFEKDLLEQCRAATMRHVVIILDAGTEIVPGMGPSYVPNVDYLVFENADETVRSKVMSGLKVTESLLICRQAAVALQELHRQEIFHQDVKPSNLLIFPDGRPVGSKTKTHVKLGDLGRASHARRTGPFDGLITPGDVLYMPFDLHYSGAVGPASDRRMIDGYSLGCVLFNLLTGQSYVRLVATELHPQHTPFRFSGLWIGPYNDVRAYVDAAHAKALALAQSQLQKVNVPDAFINDLFITLEQLLNTDPARRGHPRNRKAGVSPCDMERYVSQFDHLITQAMIYGI